jgi:signal transduction histidine kinase
MLLDETGKPHDYRFLEINPAFERMTGLKQAVGKTARELVPNLESFWFETYGSVALTGIPARFENHSEVMHRWFDVQAFRVDNPQSYRFGILFTNITERKLAEQERKRLLAQEQAARQEAERVNRLKDDFFSALSHELRTPLNPILGWTKMLQAQKLSPEKVAHALRTIERNVQQQTRLVDDLLDISSVIQGKLRLDSHPVDLALTLTTAIETVQFAAQAKGITVEYPDSGSIYTQGDGDRLQQVFWNLLSNAIKFTPDGGRVRIELSVSNSRSPSVQVRIADTGIGIAPEFLPHIFEYFYQVEGGPTRRYGGLGLGLAIVKHLVELHGGTIIAESPGLGQGATFTVKLPLPGERNALARTDSSGQLETLNSQSEFEPPVPASTKTAPS